MPKGSLVPWQLAKNILSCFCNITHTFWTMSLKFTKLLLGTQVLCL